MAETTNIEWADATANFWIGCTKLSAACDGCYAEADWDHRYGRVQWGPHGDRSPVKAGAVVVRKVQRNDAAFIAEHGRKPRIFVNSLSDFADNHKSIQQEWREAVWQLARECPDVILLILTKRPQNLPRYLPADWGDGYPNIWLGTTVEHETEHRRADALRAVPAALRFLSCEPLLGPIAPDLTSIGWVICGGESGKHARPMHPDWARSLRDQCAAAEVPFFFKQWGEWAPVCEMSEDLIESIYKPAPEHDPEATRRCKVNQCVLHNDGERFDGEAMFRSPAFWQGKRGMTMFAVGKKRAGRLLDGVEHNGMPRT